MPDLKPKLLIVEDDISSQQFYTFTLEDSYELFFVPTVSKAKGILKEHDFVASIIDVSLPGEEDGMDLIKYMRQAYPDFSSIIAITAHAFPQNRIDVLEAGAAEFFTKPILEGDLLEVLRKYIQE
ncbi:MAG: response regulator [FCB group bacterium]|nr:response regulator [FCB group bacterium]